jgi:hypothetical protein
VLLALGAAAAVAFFTQGGTGNGNVTVGHSSTITLSSDPVGPLYPGAAGASVTLTIRNQGTANQYVDTVTGAVADYVTGNGTCQGSWFSVSPVSVKTNVPAGGSVTKTAVVTMNDSGTNQDACQDQTMTINWTSS